MLDRSERAEAQNGWHWHFCWAGSLFGTDGGRICVDEYRDDVRCWYAWLATVMWKTNLSPSAHGDPVLEP